MEKYNTNTEQLEQKEHFDFPPSFVFSCFIILLSAALLLLLHFLSLLWQVHSLRSICEGCCCALRVCSSSLYFSSSPRQLTKHGKAVKNNRAVYLFSYKILNESCRIRGRISLFRCPIFRTADDEKPIERRLQQSRVCQCEV